MNNRMNSRTDSQSNSSTNNQLIARLTAALADLEPLYWQGISEFELLKVLQSEQMGCFPKDALNNELGLFNTHFLLFHCLYVLRDQWLNEGLGHLDIHTLKIVLEPIPSAEQAVMPREPLREYYLDLAQLECIDAAGVTALLEDFWSRFQGYHEKSSATEEDIANAKCVLQFQPDSMPTRAELKRRYRQLMHRHHPDKGGSHLVTTELLAAYQLLLPVCTNKNT